MTPIPAHGLCLGLVVIDLFARAQRIRYLLGALGRSVTLRNALAINVLGDAAAALTPLRLGGEPVRLTGMLRARVRVPAALLAIGIEVLVEWPVGAVCAGLVLWLCAPGWWEVGGAALAARATRAWPWVVGAALLSVACWAAGRRFQPKRASLPFARLIATARRMPTWPLAAAVPLSFINVATRTAILPILTSTLSNPPDLSASLVGSFVLIYGQLLLPTPSGIGVIELAMLGGAAGDLGPATAGVLAAWRLYTTIGGILIGGVLALGTGRRRARATISAA